MEYIILIAGISSVLIGIIPFLNGKQANKTVTFSLFCFITGIWIAFNFLAYHFGDVDYLWPVYGLAIMVLSMLLCWTYAYADAKNLGKKQLTIFTIGSVFAITTVFTDLIIKDIVGMDGSEVDIEKGPLFSLFGLFAVATVGTSLRKLYAVYSNATGNMKKRAWLVFLGLTGFALSSMLVGVILPMAGIYSFVNLDSPSSLIFTILAAIAILRYQFLDTKVIKAQLLVVLVISLSIVDIVYSGSATEFFAHSFFFLILLVLGTVLVKSVQFEVDRKEELEKANAKLLKLDEAKSEFISMASHQLRTPLTSIKGFISVMNKGAYGKIPKNLKEPVEHIEIANERLICLVEDMLNVSQMESGEMKFRFARGNVNELVEELFQSFSVMARKKNLDFELKMANELPLVMMDQAKLREMISNIIDNAIKYTENGSVSIETKSVKNSVRVHVTDTGIGLSPGERGALFDKFFRGKKAQQLKKGGVGLGLYLGRKVAQAHGGKIRVRSGGGSKGATFIVELPAIEQ